MLTAIAPVYHPPARPAGFTVTDTGVEAPTAVLPAGGETLSQVPPEFVVAVAFQLRLPVPWLAMVKVCGAGGVVPPAPKLRLNGLTTRGDASIGIDQAPRP